MRFALVAIGLAGCMKCEVYDPGYGCEDVHICCAGDSCEYRTADDAVYECDGPGASCQDAAVDMLCDVCGDAMREGLGCYGEEHVLPNTPSEHP
jgi:hypothetical protein